MRQKKHGLFVILLLSVIMTLSAFTGTVKADGAVAAIG